MTIPRTMKFPAEFDALLQSRASELGAFPAQYVQAMYRTLDRLGVLYEVPTDLAHVIAESDLRWSNGGRKGGRASKRKGQKRPMVKT